MKKRETNPEYLTGKRHRKFKGNSGKKFRSQKRRKH